MFSYAIGRSERELADIGNRRSERHGESGSDLLSPALLGRMGPDHVAPLKSSPPNYIWKLRYATNTTTIEKISGLSPLCDGSL